MEYRGKSGEGREQKAEARPPKYIGLEPPMVTVNTM